MGGVGATAAAGSSDGSATPHLPSLAEQLSYMHLPRPFKNPGYNKNVNRRAKNMKAIISQERERERAERERRRVLGKSGGGGEGGDAEAMDVEPTDGVSLDALAEEVPTCNVDPFPVPQLTLTRTLDTSIEAPPSIWPPKHYCDITGLEVRTPPLLFLSTTHPRTSTGSIHRPIHWSPIPRQEHIRCRQRPRKPFPRSLATRSHSTEHKHRKRLSLSSRSQYSSQIIRNDLYNNNSPRITTIL